jgi:hypothetical protein
LRDELAGRVEPPPPTGWRGVVRRVAGQPDAVLLGASAACLAGLLLVAAIGVPHEGSARFTVTQPGSERLNLGDETLQVRDGGVVLENPRIRPKLFNVQLEKSTESGIYASLSGHQYLLAGNVLADVAGDRVVRDSRKRVVSSAPVAGRAVLHIGGGIVSVPGIAGLALVLFAAAYAESLLRGVRRRRRARASTLAGMAFVGAVLGLGIALVGWTVGDHLLSVPYLLVAALLGNAAALALTIVLSRRDAVRT